MKCRRCKRAEGTVYLDGHNVATKTPACQECYEELVSRAMRNHGHSPGYIGPGRDPDHEQLDIEHVRAQDWWDLQTMED